jgi:hypothetical protein
MMENSGHVDTLSPFHTELFFRLFPLLFGSYSKEVRHCINENTATCAVRDYHEKLHNVSFGTRHFL